MSLFTPVRSTRKDQDSSENAPGFGHRMAPTPVIAMDGKPQLQETTPLNSKAGFSMAGKTRSVRKYNSLEESISSFHAVDSSKYLKIIEELIRARFFTSAEIICELWLSELDVSVKEDIRMKISAFMTFGDIQIHLRNFQLGIDSFDKALELLHSSSSNEIEDLFTDIHGKILRAKLEKMKTSIPHPKDSYKHMEDWDEATQFVQSIPVERRSLEMNMILANGLHALDSFDQAFQTYQKIVHNNPFCIEAALSMFKVFSLIPTHFLSSLLFEFF